MLKQDDTYNLFKKARENRLNFDENYIAIELSEHGRVYAPKLFHIKNLTVKEVLDLSLADNEEIPNKLLTYLNTKVLEENVNLGDFTKEEYIETLYYVFKVFFTKTIKRHHYIVQESDLNYLKNMNGGESAPEYLRLKHDLDTEKWVPMVDIDLDLVKTYEVPDNFIKEVTITNRVSNFSYTYGLPCYRDLRDIEDFIYYTFQDDIKKYESVEKLLKLRSEQLKRRMDGEDIPLNAIPVLPKALETQYNAYVYRRQMIYSLSSKAAYLKRIGDKDVSHYNIEDKMQLAKDPRLDLKHFTDFLEKTQNQRIGLKKEVNLISPITNAMVKYEFSLDSLIALKPFETNNLYELIVSLSKNTANSVSEIMDMQMDRVLALHNTLANLAEKEKEASEKQKDEQMKSASGMIKNPALGMSGMQSQVNRMAAGVGNGIKMPSMPSMGNFHL